MLEQNTAVGVVVTTGVCFGAVGIGEGGHDGAESFGKGFSHSQHAMAFGLGCNFNFWEKQKISCWGWCANYKDAASAS